MRTAIPVIGGVIALAVVLVLYVRPELEPALPEDAPVSAKPDSAAPVAELTPATDASAPSTLSSGPAAQVTPDAVRSPLPGETPATPMAQMIADRQQNRIVRDAPGGGPPPGLAEGEREFAAEPVDPIWAPRAEADLLAKFAQMPGLKLIDLQVHCRSTMCRLQLTQPPAAPGQDGRTPFNILRDELDLTPRWIMAVVDGASAPGRPLPMKSIAYYWREGFARRECFKDGQPVTCSGGTDGRAD